MMSPGSYDEDLKITGEKVGWEQVALQEPRCFAIYTTLWY